jgi:hypothetical protein
MMNNRRADWKTSGVVGDFSDDWRRIAIKLKPQCPSPGHSDRNRLLTTAKGKERCKLSIMNLGLKRSCLSVALAVSFFSLLATEVIGECIVSEPLRVNQLCGQVLIKGSSWPGALRLTRRELKAGSKPFERTAKTDDEGKFELKDVPAGKYEMRLTPLGMREVSVPVLVDLRHPQNGSACVTPIDLKVDFLPEPCVSPELRKPSK